MFLHFIHFAYYEMKNKNFEVRLTIFSDTIYNQYKTA